MTDTLRSLFQQVTVGFEELDETNGSVSEVDLIEAESSMEESGNEVDSTVDAVEDGEAVATGLESLHRDLSALADIGQLTVGHMRLAGHAYAGYMSHLVPASTVGFSGESAGVLVDEDAAMDDAEKETSVIVDVDKPISEEVSTEALDGLKNAANNASRAVKAGASRVWETLAKFYKRIMEFFDFAAKRRAKLKETISKLKDSDRKSGEFKVPNPKALAVDGKVIVAGIKSGGKQLADDTKTVVEKAKRTLELVLKYANGSISAEKLFEELDKFNEYNAISYIGGKVSAAAGLVDDPKAPKIEDDIKFPSTPSVSELRDLLATVEALEVSTKATKGMWSDLSAIIKKEKSPAGPVKNAVGKYRMVRTASTYTRHCARTTSAILKLVNAGVKAYGVSVDNPQEPSLLEHKS